METAGLPGTADPGTENTSPSRPVAGTVPAAPAPSAPGSRPVPSPLPVPPGRALDCITFGRANMDLYTDPGLSIEETPGFTKSIGGSPANIAVAMARLGMRVGMITRAADDPVGHFVVRSLRELGVDTSQIVFDSTGASTSVAFAETRSGGSNTVLYRNNAADLLINPAEIDEGYLASSAMLLVSGTALSVSPSRDAAMLAMGIARKAGTLVALDIDYRPYSWRSPETASVALMLAAESCDVVIGTREEFDALEAVYGNSGTSGVERDAATAQRLLAGGTAVVVVKRGKDGSTAYTATGDRVHGPVFPVVPAKVYGAGDAFAGAFLSRLLRGASLEDALTAGAANASINISKTRCAEDMATWEEITSYIKENADALSRTTP
ncbi:MAG: 5-dehydro-2-deoxygluconokinase [Alkalispirochaeta sp.]